MNDLQSSCIREFTVYTFQVWSISSNGEATELLSLFHGAAKFLKLIPSPLINQNQKQDPFAHKRPLAAICDGGSTAQFCCINFLSLRGGDIVSITRAVDLSCGIVYHSDFFCFQVKSIKFKSQVLEIAVNRISVVVSFLEKIAIFNAITLENHYTITTCYASPGFTLNPIALGARYVRRSIFLRCVRGELLSGVD